ncbi:hypothetical protein [Streptomyces sp. NPDC087310]
MLVFAIPVGVAALAEIPLQLKRRSLRERGVEATALCEERLYLGGLTVRRINCLFVPWPGTEISILVRAPQPPPRVGQYMQILFDPEDPQRAESVHYLESRDSRYTGVFFQCLLAVMLIAAAVFRFAF